MKVRHICYEFASWIRDMALVVNPVHATAELTEVRIKAVSSASAHTTMNFSRGPHTASYNDRWVRNFAMYTQVIIAMSQSKVGLDKTSKSNLDVEIFFRGRR